MAIVSFYPVRHAALTPWLVGLGDLVAKLQVSAGMMKRVRYGVFALVGPLLLAAPLSAQPQSAPEGAKVYIIWPGEGQVIRRGKFWLRMGLSGAGVAPAGVDKPNTGHHHVLIDTELPALDREIPNDKNHLHFGRGQTEARIELPPGRHTLQLLFGDANHVPHQPPLYSSKITVIVKP
jgi:hypothetical protein